MTGADEEWRVHLSEAAVADIRNILDWTAEHSGRRQARIYRETLSVAIQALTGGPDIAGARRRDEVLAGLRSVHVARHGREGRHFVLFRAADGGRRVVEILRILHDGMDSSRHVNDDAAEGGSRSEAR